MVKTGGENVASREVEEAIYKLPQVSEVAVIGVPHPRWVEAVVAVIVVKAGIRCQQDAVLAHCATISPDSRCRRRSCLRTRCRKIRAASS